MVKVFAVFPLFEGDGDVLDIPEEPEEPMKVVSAREYFIMSTKTGTTQLLCNCTKISCLVLSKNFTEKTPIDDKIFAVSEKADLDWPQALVILRPLFFF